MSEVKDCSSVAGVQAAPDGATDEPHSAGCVGPTPGQIMHRVNAEQFKPNGWVDSYPTWEDYDDAGHAKWEEMARRFTFLSSGVSRSQSEAKPSASAFAQDEQKPQSAEGLDLAELKRVAEAATPGPWQNGIDDLEGVVAPDEPGLGNVVCVPPFKFMYGSLKAWPANATYIATFDPPTVLSLLHRLETSVEAAKEARHRAEVAEAAAALMAEQRDRLLSELETARAACGTGVLRHASECDARVQRAEADLSRALEALRPFTYEPIPAEAAHTAPIMAVMTPLWVSDFRRASEVYATLSKGGGNG